MIELNTDEILAECGAEALVYTDTIAFCAAYIDSREVVPTSMFVAFKGEHTDGNAYISSALEAGVSCVVTTCALDESICTRAQAKGCAVLRAHNDDAQTFLLKLARLVRKHNPQWIVVGITGSCGKTTTKDMCQAVLSQSYKTHATKGNFNNLIGVPLTILSSDPTDEVIVCEMGMNHFNELSVLSDVVRPQLCVITNIGTSHIGFMGSRKGIAQAKAEIIQGMCTRAEVNASSCQKHEAHIGDTLKGDVVPTLFLSHEDDFMDYIRDEFARPHHIVTKTVGTSESASLAIRNVHFDDRACAVGELVYEDAQSYALHMQQPSQAACIDALFALGIAEELGVVRARAIGAIEAFSHVHMRLETHAIAGKPLVIDDSYNASPASIREALDVLERTGGNARKIAVLGEVGELGSEAERIHDYIGAYAAARKLDMLVFVGGENAHRMYEAALTMAFPHHKLYHVADVETALNEIAPLLTTQDTVLVKGSRSVQLDLFVKGVLA